VERRYVSFPQSVRDELFTQFNVGFETKFITKDHVIFENGQVLHIDGINVDTNNKVIFTRALPAKRLVTVDRTVQPVSKYHCHYNLWQKYMDDYQKYMINSAKSNHVVIQTPSYLSERENSDNNNLDI
jgi:hypothetical protein